MVEITLQFQLVTVNFFLPDMHHRMMECLQKTLMEVQAVHLSQEKQKLDYKKYLKEMRQELVILKEAVGAGGNPSLSSNSHPELLAMLPFRTTEDLSKLDQMLKNKECMAFAVSFSLTLFGNS